VHLAHPLGVKAFAYRRVKNDEKEVKTPRLSWADRAVRAMYIDLCGIYATTHGEPGGASESRMIRVAGRTMSGSAVSPPICRSSRSAAVRPIS